MIEIVIFGCAAVVFVVCTALILHRHYEDGIVGRVALALLAVAAFARCLAIAQAWMGQAPETQFNSIALLVWIGLALFLARHLLRFLRRRRCETWRSAYLPEVAGK